MEREVLLWLPQRLLLGHRGELGFRLGADSRPQISPLRCAALRSR